MFQGNISNYLQDNVYFYAIVNFRFPKGLFAATKLLRLAKNVIVDSMMMNVETNAVIHASLAITTW